MGKIIFTGNQIDDAIRKVKEGYADVSKVTAKASEVRKGKVIVDNNKIEQSGTIEDAEVKVNATIISKSYLSNDESNYPIVISPSATINRQGYIAKDIIGNKKTLYIQTEEKKVTPSGQVQKIKPSNGKLLTKVTVEATPSAPDYPIDYFPVQAFYCEAKKSTLTISDGVVKVSKGTVADNIYVKSGVSLSKAKVYILCLTNGTASTYSAQIKLVDSITHKITEKVSTLEPGEKFESVSSNITAAGTLEYKTNGHLTFTFNEDFICLGPGTTSSGATSFQNLTLFLYDGAAYYEVFVDAPYWECGTQYFGTKITDKMRRYSHIGLPDTGTIPCDVYNYNFQSAACFVSNYAPIYFHWNYMNDSTSYHLATMTHGGGTGFYIPYETKKLNDPIITIDGDTVSWEQVENATNYSISITGKSTYTVSTTETSYNLRNKITSGGTYYVKVRALNERLASDESNEVTYILSLKAPIIALSENTLSWEVVENATSYYVYKDESLWFTTSSTSIDLSSYSLEGGVYAITVKAYASNWDLSPSSNVVSYTRLDAPNLVLSSDGILSWVAVDKALTYKLVIDKEEIATSSIRIYDLTTYISLEDSHVIEVTAYGANGTFSNTSKIFIGADGRTIDTALEVILSDLDVVLTDQVVDEEEYTSKFYKITANTSATYYIYCESSSDTYGTLYDSSKSEYATSDDDYNMSFCFEVTFNAGDTYYLEARQYSRNLFTFDLHISTTNPNG